MEAERSKSPLYKHVVKTYAWMALGLLLTFGTSLAFCLSGAVLVMFVAPWLPIALLVAKLALVVYLTARITRFSVNTARGIFLAYSVLAGIALSPILLVYGAYSAILVFFVTALFFGIMAAAGIITKQDVSRFRSIVAVGLVTLLIMELVSLFLQLPGFDTAICFIGLALFLGVTTYDSKKVKDYYYTFEGDAAMLEKISIYSALNLYLDFINIFLYLLRLLGKRR